MPESILISGAGIAGPALAFWFSRSRRHEVTVIESAPTLRTGGHAVDFRGSSHMTVLQKMGLLDTLHPNGALHLRRSRPCPPTPAPAKKPPNPPAPS
jgi:2-polyprenyl-6-methoxyphenol hydroxylase-like FAD-dependent oxidoreductase